MCPASDWSAVRIYPRLRLRCVCVVLPSRSRSTSRSSLDLALHTIGHSTSTSHTIGHLTSRCTQLVTRP
eukprot:698437-Prorocentrum_minimum.AAC.1